MFNGADLGIRQEWVPLNTASISWFADTSTHPIRGQTSNATLTPVLGANATDVIDTTQGTVHMVIGGGGTSVPSNRLFFNPPACRVITAIGEPDATTGKRPPIYVKEEALWSATRNAAHSSGFASFAVDPGSQRGCEMRQSSKGSSASHHSEDEQKRRINSTQFQRC
jgi:hypothetical protein